MISGASDNGTIAIVEAELEAWLLAVHMKLPGIVNRACAQGVAETRQHLPQADTGKLDASGHAVPAKVSWLRADGEMRWSARYASFLDEGTRPHIIRPRVGGGAIGPTRPSQGPGAGMGHGQGRTKGRQRKRLAWNGPNGPVFATIVHHPGNKQMNFTRHARNVFAVQATTELALAFASAANAVGLSREWRM